MEIKRATKKKVFSLLEHSTASGIFFDAPLPKDI
jgi:hypothetical protein